MHGVLNLEDEGITILPNVSKYLSVDTPQHPRRREPSATLLCVVDFAEMLVAQVATARNTNFLLCGNKP
jgi:hypothetical protein